MSDKEKEVKKDEKEKIKEVEKESTEETVKEDKRKNTKTSNGSGVIIFILIVIILGLVFYIAYDKGLILNNNKNTNAPKVTDKDKNNGKDSDVEEDKVVELALDDALVKDNYNKVMKLWAASIYFRDSKVRAKDLSNEFVTYVAISNALGKFGQVNVTKEQMENVVYSIFGKDYPFDHFYYPNNHFSLQYNPDTGIYEYHASEGTIQIGNIDGVVKAYKDNKTLTFEIGVVFFGSNGQYYKDYQHTTAVTDLELDESLKPTLTVQNFMKGTIYKMVFNLEDGNYVFSYAEPMNS